METEQKFGRSSDALGNQTPCFDVSCKANFQTKVKSNQLQFLLKDPDSVFHYDVLHASVKPFIKEF